MTMIIDAIKASRTLDKFMSPMQLETMKDNLSGEESQFFVDKLVQMAELVSTMPKTYEQDGKGDGAIVSLHYFINSCDWYITERDIEEDQLQAFGLANLGFGGELGYISISELITLNVELDLHFTPKTLREVKQERSN